MRGRASWLAAPRSTLWPTPWPAALCLLLAGAACRTVEHRAAPPSAGADAPGNWTLPHVERARQALQAHGLALTARTTSMVVHETRASFVAATGQREPALRAWATWDQVHLLHPRLWGDDSEAMRTERLTHELCHVALLHRFADEAAARAARVPRFVTEGACSVVAGQRRLPLSLALARAAGALPLTIDVFARDPDAAYAASHALAAWLVERHGPLVFAELFSAAAKDGGEGCVERALLALTRAPDVATLWRRVVDTAAAAP